MTDFQIKKMRWNQNGITFSNSVCDIFTTPGLPLQTVWNVLEIIFLYVKSNLTGFQNLSGLVFEVISGTFLNRFL
ncbi:MAG: hypothetical protein DRQ49_01785 [Gammaproteobacteria bacterium]|nr:MAG: hypothetical protein DRQ49_01785 [Gammaproteobacteria bacterium]RKZ76491.1 MAG: hypothetical protein DRQ57_03520 [Gammaproteobacteria bacterium]